VTGVKARENERSYNILLFLEKEYGKTNARAQVLDVQ
jgi:hypothetical protein